MTMKKYAKHFEEAIDDVIGRKKVGWKKSTHQKNKWIRKNDSLEIVENYDKRGNIQFYSVEVYLFETQDELSKWLNSRRFRTKSQALAYAKAYMRKN